MNEHIQISDDETMYVNPLDGLAPKQLEFVERALAGENIFLTGKAGTGKSHAVNVAIKLLKKKGLNVAALAPTGIAAININGATLHSTFALTPYGVITWETANFVKANKRAVLKAIDVLMIDEVSMTRPDWIDALNWTLIKNGCGNLLQKQIIMIGDMKQLGIVADDNMMSVLLERYGGPQFFKAEVFPQLNVKTIELDEVQRQSDPEFIEALNIVRDGGRSDYFKRFLKSKPSGIILAPHNNTVQRYNVEGLNSIDGKMYTFQAIYDGNVKGPDFSLEPQIRVKDGCKIMYLMNSKNNILVNGTIGIFRVDDPGTEDERYFIEVEGVKYSLQIVRMVKKEYVLNQAENRLDLQEIGSIEQYPFKLAFALTIHKSQGLTFDEMTLDLTLPCFAPGQMYVGLSRVKTPEGLSIITHESKRTG